MTKGFCERVGGDTATLALREIQFLPNSREKTGHISSVRGSLPVCRFAELILLECFKKNVFGRQVMTESWGLFEEETSSQVRNAGGDAAPDAGGGVDSANAASSHQLPTPAQTAPKAKAKGKTKAKAKAAGSSGGNGNNNGQPQPDGVRSKTKLDETIAAALKLKNKYMTALSSAKQLVSLVEDGAPEWAWAANDQNIGKLDSLLKTLESKAKASPFTQSFLVTEAADVKKMTESATLQVSLDKFLELEKHVDGVENHRVTLVRMKRSYRG